MVNFLRCNCLRNFNARLLSAVCATNIWISTQANFVAAPFHNKTETSVRILTGKGRWGYFCGKHLHSGRRNCKAAVGSQWSNELRLCITPAEQVSGKLFCGKVLVYVERRYGVVRGPQDCMVKMSLFRCVHLYYSRLVETPLFLIRYEIIFPIFRCVLASL